MKTKGLIILATFFFMEAVAQSSMPKRSDFCSPSEHTGVTPDDLWSWCHDDKDDYYSECDCNYSKALKAWEADRDAAAKLKSSSNTQASSNSGTNDTNSTSENRVLIGDTDNNITDAEYYEGRRNTKRILKERQSQAINQFSNNLQQIGNQFSALIAQSLQNNYERKEQERLKKLEEKRIENERIAEEKRKEKERQIAEDKRLDELKNKPEYLNFLKKALSDAFYLDASGKEVDQQNATYEQVYIKQDNGFYVAKYYNLKESYLAFDISYEIIPNPFIEPLQTGPAIKYGVLNTKDEVNYYYRNKLKQKTLNFWWLQKMYFEFYNYKDEKVFASGEILKPETMHVASSGAITRMEYKIDKKRDKFKKYSLKFDYKGNIESLYITNEKHKIEERYKFSKY